MKVILSETLSADLEQGFVSSFILYKNLLEIDPEMVDLEAFFPDAEQDDIDFLRELNEIYKVDGYIGSTLDLSRTYQPTECSGAKVSWMKLEECKEAGKTLCAGKFDGPVATAEMNSIKAAKIEHDLAKLDVRDGLSHQEFLCVRMDKIKTGSIRNNKRLYSDCIKILTGNPCPINNIRLRISGTVSEDEIKNRESVLARLDKFYKKFDIDTWIRWILKRMRLVEYLGVGLGIHLIQTALEWLTLTQVYAPVFMLYICLLNPNYSGLIGLKEAKTDLTFGASKWERLLYYTEYLVYQLRMMKATVNDGVRVKVYSGHFDERISALDIFLKCRSVHKVRYIPDDIFTKVAVYTDTEYHGEVGDDLPDTITTWKHAGRIVPKPV